MTIRGCQTIAIDGTHASGKTTLIHALTAHYRSQGVNVVAMNEPARTSPYMDEVVFGHHASFDLAAEVDVFAAHLRTQLRAARNHQLLLADKTIINVLAYARLLLDTDERTTGVLDAMDRFCRTWAHTYDTVLYTHDRYTQPTDQFRAKVSDLQDKVDTTLRDLYHAMNIPLIDIPTGLNTTQRVAWITTHITQPGHPHTS